MKFLIHRAEARDLDEQDISNLKYKTRNLTYKKVLDLVFGVCLFVCFNWGLLAVPWFWKKEWINSNVVWCLIFKNKQKLPQNHWQTAEEAKITYSWQITSAAHRSIEELWYWEKNCDQQTTYIYFNTFFNKKMDYYYLKKCAVVCPFALPSNKVGCRIKRAGATKPCPHVKRSQIDGERLWMDRLKGSLDIKNIQTLVNKQFIQTSLNSEKWLTERFNQGMTTAASTAWFSHHSWMISYPM